MFLGACSRGALKPLRCTTHAELTLGREAARDSEEAGFLLQLIPLPQGQSGEVIRGHFKDPLEVLGRQVPLRGEKEDAALKGCAGPSPRLLSQVCPCLPVPEGQEGRRHTSSRVRSTPGGSLTRPRLVTISIS